ADTMAELHPHGDAAIYQASVNMARLWSRVRLIEGSGNFGLTYGDDAAAMRYTYERLSVYGWSMVEDLVHGAVPMITSEDHDTVEPKFLPTR
ncbi:DNA gyrase subunit A, partial [Escherichia coli]|uniref:DNA gyrase subunit A n=1 Tax=Escherichia coli TaxID=562 RepID=UPI00289902A9